MTMASEHDLTLIGVTWMIVRFDEFVREIYVQAGMNPRCAACHGVPGYADPCPSPVNSVHGPLSAGPALLLTVCLLLASLL